MYAVIVREDKNVKYFSEDGFAVSVVEKNYKAQQPYMKLLKNGCQYLFESRDDATEFISFLMHTVQLVSAIKMDLAKGTSNYAEHLGEAEKLYQRNVELANKEGREYKPNMVAQVYHMMYQMNKKQQDNTCKFITVWQDNTYEVHEGEPSMGAQLYDDEHNKVFYYAKGSDKAVRKYHEMLCDLKEQGYTERCSSGDMKVAEAVQEYKPSPRYIIGNYHVKLVRESSAKYKNKVVQCADDAADIAWQYLSDRDRETLIVLLLDSQNTCIGINEVSMGSLTRSLTHPREVFKPAILSNAAAIILAHNHPSGKTNASKPDIEITEQMVKAGKILGIGVLDHVIVGYNTMRTSIKEEGRVNFD